ncbi:MAG: hypothetical protein JXA91_06595 [Candidatus Thermoplasmatota archaeon]|nr:hypothetical protein [Candidatus Thermoplasmatota archaeon]
MELLGIEIGELFTSTIIQFVITVLLGGILLHIATGILKFEKRSFTIAIAVVIVGGVFLSFLNLISIPFVWLLGLIGYWFLIKNLYNVGWVKAILAWLMSIFVAFVIALILIAILGFSAFLFY